MSDLIRPGSDIHRSVCFGPLQSHLRSMPIPTSGQTVNLMSWRDVLRVRRDLRRREGRNAFELELYTTDDLRRLYQATNDDPVRLRDGIVSRAQLVAEIRWRVFWDRFGYAVLLYVSMIAAIGAVFAAIEGWK